MGLPPRLRAFLARPTARWWIAAIAVALCLPALWTGWILDDHGHQLMLRAGDEFPEMRRAPTDLYTFLPDDETWRRNMRELGSLAWYANPEIHASFWRPLSSLLLYLDHVLAPGSALVAHAQSLLWLAGLVLVVAGIFRRLFDEPWVAGLATLLYAVDDGHVFDAAWVANRNALVAMVFAGLALLCHVEWRQRGGRLAALLAPACLALGLLGGEMALAITPYIFAYAVFLDGNGTSDDRRLPLRRRLATLLPCAAVGVVFLAAYAVLGYGFGGSGLYLDPIDDPMGYLAAAGPRLLALVQGQLTPTASETLFFLPPPWRAPFLLASLVTVAVLFGICAGMIRRSALARFFATGLVLSALPLCATFAHDRLLLPMAIGGCGLVAQVVAGWSGTPQPAPDGYWRRRSVRLLAVFFVAVHLVLSPLLVPVKIRSAKVMGRTFEAAALSLDRVADFSGRTLVFVTGPDFFYTAWTVLIRQRLGLSAPERLRILGTTWNRVTVTRVDERTLRIAAAGGFLVSKFDVLMRDPADRFRVGDRFETSDLRVEVTRVTSDGRPAEILGRFDTSLGDGSRVFVAWHVDGYHDFPLPEVGANEVLEPVGLWDFFLLGI